MQLRHVSTNLRQGLRRNLSMHAAVILTLFVSLSLAGIGVMLSKQADLTAEAIGNELQISVTLCVPNESDFPQCVAEVTPEQEAAIKAAIDENPEARSYEEISKAEGLQKIKDLGVIDEKQLEGDNPIFTEADVPKTIRVTLEDPEEYEGLVSALQNLDGVRDITTARELVGPVFATIDAIKWAAWGAAAILVLAAVMLVANTIRLAALARRKEIEIMRLVGASRIFISLPFVLEALFNAVMGVALSAGALAAFTRWGIIKGIDPKFDGFPFVGWPEYGFTVVVLAIAGPVLTVLPTLLLTRKYLRF
ncbi:FtsX-like permease family protein [Nocardioides dongxiaopingii]|uniref:permease-like cell division protein FtsX n=1 Tax=Nocardioides TaxID=1839 RepID=UPI0010C76C78|nr:MULTISPECIES: permease-like cell division protein FtsX [Nocardioides]QCW49883.2 FtsX-like permease family protein [Nocardioides sp. S-1144]